MIATKKTLTAFFLLLVSSTCFGQDWTDEKDWADEKNDGTPSLFFAGINIGALFPNDNTAIIYNGSQQQSNYGITHILNVPTYKLAFDQYFQHPYALTELPINSTYKTALDLGLHAGVNVVKGVAIYLDVNFSRLKYEQSFTILVDDPNNQLVEPTYEQFPIFGEEKRINFNLGTQLSLYHEGSSNLYWAFFGNLNSIKMEKNYIIINNVEYQIFHGSAQQPSQMPGGTGFGAGSALGFKLGLSDNILVDLSYNLYYTKTKMNENVQGFGINHGITFRLLWN